MNRRLQNELAGYLAQMAARDCERVMALARKMGFAMPRVYQFGCAVTAMTQVRPSLYQRLGLAPPIRVHLRLRLEDVVNRCSIDLDPTAKPVPDEDDDRHWRLDLARHAGTCVSIYINTHREVIPVGNPEALLALVAALDKIPDEDFAKCMDEATKLATFVKEGAAP